MPLEEYKRKRRFDSTPEPEGVFPKEHKQLRFVVQEHQASHLHYDFRLEIKGVLKSWAVPKGPSMNPSEKRLAIMVEDHPYEYRKFEGVIPEGNYGAGAVKIWDEGSYEPLQSITKHSEDQLLQDLKTGHLRFILHGKKLSGAFSLMKLNSNKMNSKNSWLLVKKKDT